MHASVAVTTSLCSGHGKPYLVRDPQAVHCLQQKFEADALLEFDNRNMDRLTRLDADDVAAVDLTFYVEASALKKGLHNGIECGFRHRATMHLAYTPGQSGVGP